MKTNAITILLLSFCIFQIHAQNRYWVGDSGNWSDSNHWSESSGGPGGASLPTAINNAIFDVNSFPGNGTLNIDIAADCNDLDWTSSNPANIQGSATTTLSISGNLTLNPNLNYNFSGNLNLIGSGLHNITTHNISISSNLNFIGSGSWTLQDELTTTKDIAVDNGSFVSNGHTLNAGELGSNSMNSMFIDLSNSVVHLTKNFQGAPNMSLQSNGSLLFLDAINAEIRNSNGLQFNQVIFSASNSTGFITNSNNSNFQSIQFGGNGEINGSHTIDSIFMDPPHTLNLGAGETQTITFLEAQGGCFDPINIKSTIAGSQANLSKSNGTLEIENVTIQDINATGGANFAANNSLDLGNNTGWIINIGRDLYWVGGAGDWLDAMHWSTSSGGPGGTCPPSKFDDVFFDSNSFSAANQTVSFNQSIECHDMDWTAATNTPQFNNATSFVNLSIYGSLFCRAEIQIRENLRIFMSSDDPGEAILSNGYLFKQAFVFDGNGTWDFFDEFKDGASITLSNGTINTNGHLLKINNLSGTNGTINLGNSNVEVANSFSLSTNGRIIQNNSHIFLAASNATFNCSFSDINFLSFNGDGTLSGQHSTYDSILVNGNFRNIATNDTCTYLDIGGNGTFARSLVTDTLLLAAATTHTLSRGVILTINDSLRAISSCSEGYIQFFGQSGNSNGNEIIRSNSKLNIEFARLRYMEAQGPLVPFIASNSVDMGENQNWTFNESPRTLYWVGGTGDWNDPAHWSLSSGGPGFECIPWIIDDVIFDNNSFSNLNETVTIDKEAFCKDMIWTTPNSPILIATNTGDLNAYGSIEFAAGMSIPDQGFARFFFRSAGNATIKTNGVLIGKSILFTDTGTYEFLDDFNSNKIITQQNGTLLTNDFNVASNSASFAGTVDFGNTFWTCTQGLSISNGAFIDADSSTFYVKNMTVSGSWEFDTIFISNGNLNAQGCSFNKVEFILDGSLFGGSNGNYYKHLSFNRDGDLLRTGDVIDTLCFSPGFEYRFSANLPGDTINVWKAVSSCAEGNIIIKSTSTIQANIFSPNPITLEVVELTGIAISGPSTYTASNAVDNGNNSGWQFNSSSRNLFWVGGSGLWSEAAHWSLSSGGPGGECIPTLIDNVYFDANSFTDIGQTFALDKTVDIHSMFWENVNFNPNWNGAAFGLNLSGSLVLDQNIDLDYSGNINFESQGMDSLKTDNLNLRNPITFKSSGNYTLIDSFKNILNLLVQEDAQLDASENYISARNVLIGNSSSIDIENSIVFINFGAGGFSLGPGSGLSALNSTLILTANGGRVSGGTQAFHNAVFLPSSTFNVGNALNCNNCTFNKVEFQQRSGIIAGSGVIIDSLILASGYIYRFSGGSTTQVNEYLEVSGNCNAGLFTTLESSNNTPHNLNTNFPTNLTECRIEGINAGGPNIPFNAPGSFDFGNNNNIEFSTVPRNLYWVGGNGSWYQGSHWSLSSGGSPGECPPTQNDHVFFDNNSFDGVNQVVTLNDLAICKDMDWSGSELQAPALNKLNALVIHGSLTFNPNMNITGGANMTFKSSTAETIVTGEINIVGNMIFNGGGQYDLLDDLKLNAHNLIIDEGHLNTNSNELFVNSIFMNNGTALKSLALNNSIVHINKDIVFTGTNVSLNAGTSNLRFENNSPQNLNAGNLSYHNVLFTATNVRNIVIGDAIFNEMIFNGDGTLNGNMTIGKLVLSSEKSYRFQSGKSVTILDEIVANGNCEEFIEITASNTFPSSFASIIKTNGNIDLSSVNINNVHGLGGAAFNAFNAMGTNATGWNIVNGDNAILYWIGGNGDWHDQSNWAYTSGGPGGACLPGQFNDVVFDQNSFTSNGEELQINANAICKNMTWTADVNAPSLFGNDSKDIQIYGSLELAEGMNINFLGNIFFESFTTGNTIKSNGNILKGNLFFQGIGGEWTMTDSLNTTKDLHLRNGTLLTNNQNLTFNALISQNQTPRTFNLGNSLVKVNGEGEVWDLEPLSLNFNAGTSTITFNGDNVDFTPNSNFNYYDIIFNDQDAQIINSDNVQFHNVQFYGNGMINGSHTYNDLTFSPSFTYVLEANTTQSIGNDLNISGQMDSLVTIQSSSIGNQASFAPSVGPLCYEYLNLMDNAIIDFTYFATNSIDSGNNGNWVFSDGIYYPDEDNDGYGDANAIAECLPCPNCVDNNLDCDDSNPNLFPGSIWTCIGNECDAFLNTLTIASSPSTKDTATSEIITPDGWTHYVNCFSGRLLLSIQKDGEDIGNIGQNEFLISHETTAKYGTGGENLSTADYLQADDWYSFSRIWEVNNANALNDKVKVRFYYDGTDVMDLQNTILDSSGQIIDSSSFYFYKVSGIGISPLDTDVLANGGSFNQYRFDETTSGLYTWTPGTAFSHSYGEFETTGFSGGGVGASSNGSPLPLQLLTFDVKAKEKHNEILWQTALSVGVSHFELERANENLQFQPVYTNPAINSNTIQDYRFKDEDVKEGIQYYRLRIVDLDGRFYYSSIKSIQRNERLDIQVYPNPTDQYLYLTYAEGIEFKIINNQGKKVMEAPYNSKINLASLANGVYILELNTARGIQRFKFIKM